MTEQWIKASEIGEYLYCQRAWWYRMQGAQSANARALEAGTLAHVRHGRGLRSVFWLRLAAFGLVVLALLLLVTQN